MNFVGIVDHVELSDKKHVNDELNIKLVISVIKLESIDCRSRLKLYVKHMKRVNLKTVLKKGNILLVKNAQRKVSTNVDIQA